jgi:tRNA (adenine22-N1)-methyltransferase
MRLPKLDNRLNAIYEMLGGIESVCDIGADHGKLALILAKNGARVIATDISGPSLRKTERLAKLHGADIDTRLSDGLSGVATGEVQAAIMAGMGQNTIIEIIKQSRQTVEACEFVVMQPMNGEYDLRSFLSGNGFNIVEESVAQEGKRLYCIIKAAPYGGGVLTEAEKYFGPCLLEDKNALNAAKYFERNIAILEGIARGMESVGDTKGVRFEKIKEALAEVKGIL